MAEEHNKSEQVEVSDRGLFDFVGKKEKEEKATQEEVLVTGVEKLHVEEAPKVEEKKEGLLDKLHRSNSSSSSSSSDEEEGPDGEKKKKKKGLKENIKEKLHGDKKEAEEEKIATVVMTEQDVVVAAPVAQPAAAAAAAESEHTNIVVEKIDDTVKVEAAPGEDKKGFLEKIKEKLPGHHKKEAQEQVAIEETVAVGEGGEGQDGKEKKGILGKIMDKLPGYHKEETDKNTPPAGH